MMIVLIHACFRHAAMVFVREEKNVTMVMIILKMLAVTNARGQCVVMESFRTEKSVMMEARTQTHHQIHVEWIATLPDVAMV